MTTRTTLSLKNAQIALFFYFINLILRFFSRKIFLDYLGAEVLGLNTTAQNLLGFLNIAELGIGAAVSYTLYTPLYNKDFKTINEIVSLQGWLYRNVAYIVIVGACGLMCSFPWLFAKMELPLWYAYGSFLVFLYSSLLGYFVNYKQILFSADQKEYKNTIHIQGWGFCKVILQICAICYLKNGYVWWMILEIVMSTLTSITLNKNINKEYQWLKTSTKAGNKLRKKYPEIVTKIKQVFFHKIAGLVLTQTSPIIIYAYTSLTLVAIYGNYMQIIIGITMLMQALFNSIVAGIGNLIAENNKEKIKSFFWELTLLRLFIAAIICFTTYKVAHIFIAVWIGQEYILDQNAFTLLCLITFITLTRTCDLFLSAYGMYQDIAAPIIETVLNLGFSILLGYHWGLTGILSGVLISLFVIVVCWKPYFLYHSGFKQKISEYILRYNKYIFLLLGGGFMTSWILKLLYPNITYSYTFFVSYSLSCIIVYTGISAFLLYFMDNSMRNLFKRAKKLLKK